MVLWRITTDGPEKVPTTKISDENLLEQHLEDWVAADSTLLGEPLWVIGRQVLIPEVRDRLDLLALDTEGKAVIIELKRGQLTDPVDVQALRYASYISNWGFKDFEDLARNYLKRVGDADFNFNAQFEAFCEANDVVDVPDLNRDQRMILVGSGVREKVVNVALWLRSHTVDVKVIEIQAFREDTTLLIQPTVIVPLPIPERGIGAGPVGAEKDPWTSDGRSWHLEKRCSPKTKEILLNLDKELDDLFELDGPRWNQKYYVAYRIGNYNWLAVITRANVLLVDLLVRSGAFTAAAIAQRLSIEEFDRDDSMAEKLNLSSSVVVLKVNENTDRVRIRMKEDFDVQSSVFRQFLTEAHRASRH